MIIGWNIIGIEDSRLIQNRKIDLSLRNCTQIFKVISKLCTPRIITIDQKLKETISIDPWNFRKKAIHSHLLTNDQSISYGTLVAKLTSWEHYQLVQVHNAVKWVEAKLVHSNQIELSLILSMIIPRYKQFLSLMDCQIRFFSKECMLSPKIWIH